jgi:hypothetical protein
MTIGFFGAPPRPIVLAIGIPSSMCVACMSPLLSESRIAAQLRTLATVELMPYFLKRPFSCAITMLEQSVSAMMPSSDRPSPAHRWRRRTHVQPLGRPGKERGGAPFLRNERRGWMEFDSWI